MARSAACKFWEKCTKKYSVALKVSYIYIESAAFIFLNYYEHVVVESALSDVTKGL